MQHGAHIGSTVVIKGEISAKEPLMVSGRVDGSITVPGFVVTIASGAHVTADVEAGGIIVGGTVTGSLVAEERIALSNGAEVEGDMIAPRIAVEDGAFVCGKVLAVGPAGAKLSLAS